jgi:tRNA pseudouridine55 synthase
VSKPRRFHREIDGILLLDKPLGVSSNAALQQVRAIYRAAKAGHAGSLDPLASGLLPVCFGQATKVCGRLLNSAKTYRVVAQLGARTPSGDCETEIVEQAPIPSLDEASIDAVLASFVGEQEQVPPMHSALKFEGKRLYELARRGESVERAPRRIVLHSLRRVSYADGRLEFDVHCSKGTYIRSLAADIGARLGTLAYVAGLRRLSVDPFGSLPMMTIPELAAADPAGIDSHLLAADIAFADLPQVTLHPDAERSLLLGQAVRADTPLTGAEARIYGATGRFLGLGERVGEDQIRPVRLFVTVGSN